MLLGSLIIGLVGSYLPGPGWMCLGVDSSFSQPVFTKDNISINISVSKVVKVLGVAILDGEIINQRWS